MCKYDKREVVIATCFVECWFNSCDQLRDTLLHEIAHVIAGLGTGHGPVWLEAARRLGCSGNRLHNMKSVKQMDEIWQLSGPFPVFITA